MDIEKLREQKPELAEVLDYFSNEIKQMKREYDEKIFKLEREVEEFQPETFKEKAKKAIQVFKKSKESFMESKIVKTVSSRIVSVSSYVKDKKEKIKDKIMRFGISISNQVEIANEKVLVAGHGTAATYHTIKEVSQVAVIQTWDATGKVYDQIAKPHVEKLNKKVQTVRAKVLSEYKKLQEVGVTSYSKESYLGKMAIAGTNQVKDAIQDFVVDHTKEKMSQVSTTWKKHYEASMEKTKTKTAAKELG